MKRNILMLGLTLSCVVTAFSQQAETRTDGQATTTASVSQAGQTLNIQSGTRLAAELQNSIDVRKSKVGDEVVLSTSQAIKSDGRIVVDKGARLIGRVTDVERKSKANGGSRIGLRFDRLSTGSLELPISVTINSITQGGAHTRQNDQDMISADANATSSTSSRSTSSSQGGGLISGVVNTTTSTVGSVVNATAGAVGAAVDATGRVVSNATGGSGSSLGRIQIAESTSTSAEGGAVLSLRGENLRLEKGTNFNLMINQSASASKEP